MSVAENSSSNYKWPNGYFIVYFSKMKHDIPKINTVAAAAGNHYLGSRLLSTTIVKRVVRWPAGLMAGMPPCVSKEERKKSGRWRLAARSP